MDELQSAIVTYVTANPGKNRQQIQAGIDAHPRTFKSAMRALEESGELVKTLVQRDYQQYVYTVPGQPAPTA